MKELITKTNNLLDRVRKLEALETPRTKGTWANRPNAPVADQTYEVTDRNHETYYWYAGATPNWLSTKLYEVELRPTAAAAQPQTYAVTTNNTNRRAINNFLWSTSYVVDYATMTIAQAATTDATHYCTVNFNRVPGAGAGVAEIQVKSDVAGKVAGTIYNYKAAGNLSTVFTSTNAPVWNTDTFLVGAGAGAVTVEGLSIWIRLVG